MYAYRLVNKKSLTAMSLYIHCPSCIHITVKRPCVESLKFSAIKFMSEYLEKSMSPKVDLVVDAYEHAVLAKFPQNRYPVGNDMKFLYLPMSWLPFPYQVSAALILSSLGLMISMTPIVKVVYVFWPTKIWWSVYVLAFRQPLAFLVGYIAFQMLRWLQRNCQ